MAIRFSEIIEHDSKAGPKKKVPTREVSLRKIGILDEDEVVERDTAHEAGKYYEKLYKLADQVRAWVNNDEVMNIALITPVLHSMIKKNLTDHVYHYATFTVDEVELLGAHAVEVTLLSIKIGVGLNFDEKRLADLAIVAFLQDVGMYKIPPDILAKRGTLSNQEFKEIQRHPEISADILSRLNDKDGWMADVALQVHERADASGYPFGLKGEEIHDYAYIIGVADIYTAMTHDRPYRERIQRNRVVRAIMDSAEEAFPSWVVKAFLNQVSFFPLGSYVKLNDRSIGRVVKTDSGFPLRPTVEILNDNHGSRVEKKRIVDLSEQLLLYITGSMDENDIVY
jgi:HD-GYP domain-containing protein (c-di-GMP phosphodiesterase class II)